jgi:hypothetical protein
MATLQDLINSVDNLQQSVSTLTTEVNMRTVNDLPDGFENVFENTVIDNRYPHAFS